MVLNDVHDDDQPSEQGKKRKLRSSTLATGTAKRRRDATGERLSPKTDSEYKKLPNAEDENVLNGALVQLLEAISLRVVPPSAG